MTVLLAVLAVTAIVGVFSAISISQYQALVDIYDNIGAQRP